MRECSCSRASRVECLRDRTLSRDDAHGTEVRPDEYHRTARSMRRARDAATSRAGVSLQRFSHVRAKDGGDTTLVSRGRDATDCQERGDWGAFDQVPVAKRSKFLISSPSVGNHRSGNQSSRTQRASKCQRRREQRRNHVRISTSVQREGDKWVRVTTTRRAWHEDAPSEPSPYDRP